MSEPSARPPMPSTWGRPASSGWFGWGAYTGVTRYLRHVSQVVGDAVARIRPSVIGRVPMLATEPWELPDSVTPGPAGWFALAVHAGPSGFRLRGRPISPADLALAIWHCARWRGRPVLLVTQTSAPADGAGPMLRQLAIEMGAPVYAADAGVQFTFGRASTDGQFWCWRPGSDEKPQASGPVLPPPTAVRAQRNTVRFPSEAAESAVRDRRTAMRPGPVLSSDGAMPNGPGSGGPAFGGPASGGHRPLLFGTTTGSRVMSPSGMTFTSRVSGAARALRASGSALAGSLAPTSMSVIASAATMTHERPDGGSMIAAGQAMAFGMIPLVGPAVAARPMPVKSMANGACPDAPMRPHRTPGPTMSMRMVAKNADEAAELSCATSESAGSSLTPGAEKQAFNGSVPSLAAPMTHAGAVGMRPAPAPHIPPASQIPPAPHIPPASQIPPASHIPPASPIAPAAKTPSQQSLTAARTMAPAAPASPIPPASRIAPAPDTSPSAPISPASRIASAPDTSSAATPPQAAAEAQTRVESSVVAGETASAEAVAPVTEPEVTWPAIMPMAVPTVAVPVLDLGIHSVDFPDRPVSGFDLGTYRPRATEPDDIEPDDTELPILPAAVDISAAPESDADVPEQAIGAPVWVPVLARTEDDDRDRMRTTLGWKFQTHSRTVARTMSMHPGLRTAIGSHDVMTGLVAVLALLDGDGERINAALRDGGTPDEDVALLARCAAAGLMQLPAVGGPVFGIAPDGIDLSKQYSPGELLVEPGFTEVSLAAGNATTPRYAIWSSTARRFDQLRTPQELAARGGRAMFPAGTRFTVLDVGEDDGPHVLLREIVFDRRDSALDERVIRKLRAALAVPTSNGVAPAALAWPLGLDGANRRFSTGADGDGHDRRENS